MASKKDFSGINTGRVYGALEQATSRKGQQGKASPQEAAQRAEELRTQGRKDCKATRINMAFSPSNHEFVRIMARATGRTMTETVNLILTKYQEEHPELMEKAQDFLQEINYSSFSKLGATKEE